jgi:hypothetical protein
MRKCRCGSDVAKSSTVTTGVLPSKTACVLLTEVKSVIVGSKIVPLIWEKQMIQKLIKVLSAAAFTSFAFVLSATALPTSPKPYDLCGDLKVEKALAGGISPFQTTSKAFVSFRML